MVWKTADVSVEGIVTRLVVPLLAPLALQEVAGLLQPKK